MNWQHRNTTDAEDKRLCDAADEWNKARKEDAAIMASMPLPHEQFLIRIWANRPRDYVPAERAMMISGYIEALLKYDVGNMEAFEDLVFCHQLATYQIRGNE